MTVEREARDALRALLRSAVSLYHVLGDAEAYQWSASPTEAAPRTEGGRPVGGPPADPTAEAATDPRRLRLRAEVIEAHRQMDRAREALEVARRRLERALEGWTGSPDSPDKPECGEDHNIESA